MRSGLVRQYCGPTGMKTLPFGTFNGERCKGLDLNGLVVGEFRDRPEDTITQHTHEDTHFQFLLKGLYVTGAEGLESPCSPPTVIFNPAGTRHRDRFEIRGGSFLALSVTRNIMARIENDCVALESAQSASLEVK